MTEKAENKRAEKTQVSPAAASKTKATNETKTAVTPQVATKQKQSDQQHNNLERNQKVAQKQAQLRQKEGKKELKTVVGIFAGLTKRNEDYLFRLNKILTQRHYDSAKKEVVLQELSLELREKQKQGLTANRLYGTPSQKADTIIAGPKKKPQPITFWKMALDNGLMMLALFCAMYAVMGMVSPKSIKVNGGILTLVVTSVLAGVGMAFFYQMAADRRTKKKRIPFWKMLLWSVVLVVIWMAVFTGIAAIPGVVNSALNPAVYAVLAALAFVIRYYLKKKIGLRSTPF